MSVFFREDLKMQNFLLAKMNNKTRKRETFSSRDCLPVKYSQLQKDNSKEKILSQKNNNKTFFQDKSYFIQINETWNILYFLFTSSCVVASVSNHFSIFCGVSKIAQKLRIYYKFSRSAKRIKHQQIYIYPTKVIKIAWSVV